MKVAYNWLKEFVDMPAPPDEIAIRLALAGTNIASIEKVSHGAVIDAEVSSNRPDCLGMLGIAREVSAIYGCLSNCLAEAGGKLGTRRKRRNLASGAIRLRNSAAVTPQG